jgi:hypothetical protein
MNYLPMDKLGAIEISPKVLQFGIFLPGVDPAGGYSVSIKIIHEKDQYMQAVQPVTIAQTPSVDPVYGDFWSGTLDLNTVVPSPSSAFGQPGRYVYRYVVHSPTRGDIDFIIDPFSREVGVGRLSAITVGAAPYTFSANETKWKTPALKNAILYELMISEFRDDLGRTIAQLPYLADLGINCIEVMPVSNVLSTIDWGYDPIGYFCVAERFGRESDFQLFVDQAHQNGTHSSTRLSRATCPIPSAARAATTARSMTSRKRLRRIIFTPSTSIGSIPFTSTAFASTMCPNTGTAPPARATPTWSSLPISMSSPRPAPPTITSASSTPAATST